MPPVFAGNEFSYRPVWVELPGDGGAKPQHPLELADRRDLSSEELEDLSLILAERQEESAQANEERDRIGLDRAFDEGLIAGISFFIIGALVWAAHMFGRSRLETPEDRAGPLNRVYLVLLTVIFGVITIVSLPQAVFETLRYAVLDPVSDRYHPGEKLALVHHRTPPLAGLPLALGSLSPASGLGSLRLSRRRHPWYSYRLQNRAFTGARCS